MKNYLYFCATFLRDMYNAFSLQGLFMGVYLAVPFVLGCLFLSGIFTKHTNHAYVHRIVGALLIVDALYVAIRTWLMYTDTMHHEYLHVIFYVLDITFITFWGLVPVWMLWRKQSDGVMDMTNDAELPKEAEVKVIAELSDETKDRNNEAIAQALTKKCVEGQMYLDRNLTIDTLARECGTNRTYLSYYLHDELHQSFYEYINELRLQQVDALMLNPRLSQEAIALKCGFNSARTMRSAYLRLHGKELSR